ncbi:MAG: hypothetical protein ACYDEO_08305 [Aggregatilineales bacterium]
MKSVMKDASLAPRLPVARQDTQFPSGGSIFIAGIGSCFDWSNGGIGGSGALSACKHVLAVINPK